MKSKHVSENKIISPLELHQKLALLLAEGLAIPQMENTLIINSGSLLLQTQGLINIINPCVCVLFFDFFTPCKKENL